ERRDPLDDTALDLSPLRRGDDPRDRVERQDAVNGIAVRIDREGDAEFMQRLLCGGSPALELGHRDRGETLAKRRGVTTTQHLAIKAAGVVPAQHGVPPIRTRPPSASTSG